MFRPILLSAVFGWGLSFSVAAQSGRAYWLREMDRLARPVLYNLAVDSLRARMPVQLSPRIDNAGLRRQDAYLEAFGRLLSGIGPWLNGEGGGAAEVALRNRYRAWTLRALSNAVNPDAHDYMAWKAGGQPLVDAAFLALGLVRAPWIWEHSDSLTRARLAEAFRGTRDIRPGQSNWLLFSGMIEAFFCRYGLPWDRERLSSEVYPFLERWYLGDGVYGDGPPFHEDYYNSFVIHPFLSAILDATGTFALWKGAIHARDQRYAEILERLVAVDGTFPIVGRSMVYRGGAFHHLADMASRHDLPADLPPAQVREALTAVLHRTMDGLSGWLPIGVHGEQPEMADTYITSGSGYLCADIFLPLGLPAGDPFWSDPPTPWTARKVWEGKGVPPDHAPDGVADLLRPAAGQGDLLRLIDSTLALADTQYRYLATHTPPDVLPRSFSNGREITSGPDWWTCGFFPGTLLELYAFDRDTVLLQEAKRRMRLLERNQFNRGTHDLGFMMYIPYHLLKDSGSKRVLMNSAHSLSTRFNPRVGCIKSWDHSPWAYPVIIDNMMNLELLCWATAHSGDSTYYRMAVTHANTTLKNHYRPDYSSYHVVDYDTATGAVIARKTAQGYADGSAWARGQAWGLYGFTMMYRETRDPTYLLLAEHIARYLLSRLPQDGIPYWDFDDTGTYRDASSAAVMASAFIELSAYTDKTYLQAAAAILRTLCGPQYRAAAGENGGFLLYHGVGNLPGKSEVDVPLTYADYYFVEAMLRYRETR